MVGFRSWPAFPRDYCLSGSSLRPRSQWPCLEASHIEKNAGVSRVSPDLPAGSASNLGPKRPKNNGRWNHKIAACCGKWPLVPRSAYSSARRTGNWGGMPRPVKGSPESFRPRTPESDSPRLEILQSCRLGILTPRERLLCRAWIADNRTDARHLPRLALPSMAHTRNSRSPTLPSTAGWPIRHCPHSHM
jgi:hypothetical protein